MYGFIHKWFHNLFHHYSLSGSWMLLLIKEKKKKKGQYLSLRLAKWVALVVDCRPKIKPKTTLGACQWCPVSELQIAWANSIPGSQVNCLLARTHLSQVTHLPGNLRLIYAQRLLRTPKLLMSILRRSPAFVTWCVLTFSTQLKPPIFRFDVL